MSAKLLPEAKTDHTLKKLLIVVSIRLIPVISLQLLFWSGEISPLAEKALRIGNYHTILLHPLQTSFSAKNAMTEAPEKSFCPMSLLPNGAEKSSNVLPDSGKREQFFRPGLPG